MTINYVTGNEFKIYTAQLFMNKYNIKINQIKMDLPEIQDMDVEKVAIFSSKYAYDKLKVPVLKNDGGLFIPALNNFPAAFTRFVEEALGEDGILKLMEGIENREAYWLEALAYTDESGTKVFLSKTPGTIAKTKSGENGWGYDKIFIPYNVDKTLANYDDETRGRLWAQAGYGELAEFILSKNK